jgi:ribosomal-protein-alanine N-acetyltransferase
LLQNEKYLKNCGIIKLDPVYSFFEVKKMMIHHKGTIPIETIRLKLRRFEEKDANDMFGNWAGDPEVCKYLSWGPHKNVEFSRRRVKDWVNSYKYNSVYVWAIEHKKTQQVIGSISVEIADDINKSCEVGYCVGKDYWSRGIMTEALLAVMHFLFYEVGYQKVIAKHDVLNIASGRVMQKAGMNFVKIENQVGHRRDGSLYDCAVYAKNRMDD